jgi:hypothetical protein
MLRFYGERLPRHRQVISNLAWVPPMWQGKCHVPLRFAPRKIGFMRSKLVSVDLGRGAGAGGLAQGQTRCARSPLRGHNG